MTSGIRALLIAACAVLGAGGSSVAQGAWDIDALMRSFAAVKSAKGTFIERRHVPILTAPLEHSGTLAYMAPRRIEKRTLTPDPVTMIVDNDTLTVEEGAGGRRRTLLLREHPVVWAFIESIRSTLAGDLASLRRFYELRLEGDERQWRLLLLPHGAEMRDWVKEIRLGGRGNRITSVEVFETGGGRSAMTITGDAS